MPSPRVRRRTVIAGLSATLLVVAGTTGMVAVDASRDRANMNGAGVTYRGSFYALVGAAEVRESHLGRVLERDHGFRDTRTTLRQISGLDPAVAVAARVPQMPGPPAVRRSVWVLMSPDRKLAADPWSRREVAAVLHPYRK